MSVDEAERRIEQWDGGLLDLSGLDLANVPDTIGRLASLTRLSLSRNQLTTIPDSVTRLTKLTELSLAHNHLTTVPDTVARLTNLTLLSLTGNQLVTVPEAVTRLINLTLLSLYDNRLATLPDTITQLTNLTELYLNNNQLRTVPDPVARLTNLTELSLAGNQLATLPETIGRLTNLTLLYLDGNRLTQLPDTIGQLTNLVGLSLTENQLTTLPVALQFLARLERVTTTGTSTRIGELRLGNNPFPQSLIDAANQGLPELIEYLRNPPEQPNPPTGEPAGQDRGRAIVDFLDPTAAATTKTALEEPFAEIGRFLDDPGIELTPDHENFLRVQLGTVDMQLRGTEPDRFIVERGIRLIVQRLVEVGHVGTGVRKTLERLEAKPPELIETIVECLDALVHTVGDEWGNPDNRDPTSSVVQAGKQAENLGRNLDQASRSIREESDKSKPGNPQQHRWGEILGEVGPTPQWSDVTNQEVRDWKIDQLLIRISEAVTKFWKLWAPF